MGRLNALVSFVRKVVDDGIYTSDAQVGGPPPVTVEHASVPGDDSVPLPGDTVVTVPRPGSGREVAVAYMDTALEPKAAAGEKRIYARKSDGTLACALWLQATGDIVFEDANGQELARIAADGTTHLGEYPAAAQLSRADRTDAEIAKLWIALGDHVHGVTVTGTATSQSGTTLSPTITDTSAPTGSDKVWGT